MSNNPPFEQETDEMLEWYKALTTPAIHYNSEIAYQQGYKAGLLKASKIVTEEFADNPILNKTTSTSAAKAGIRHYDVKYKIIDELEALINLNK